MVNSALWLAGTASPDLGPCSQSPSNTGMPPPSPPVQEETETEASQVALGGIAADLRDGLRSMRRA